MTYRRLTEAELQVFAEEWVAQHTWRAYASYATDVYGAAAERIKIVAGTERSLCFHDVAALRDGDYFSGGKLFDAEGKEIPLVADAPRKAVRPEATNV